MSETKRLSLFFLKSPDVKMSAIETYLKKRNYEVTICTDIKESLVKIIELQPQFVFLAYDHINPKIANVSHIIDQSIITTIIAFVHSNTKESMRKINFCPIKHKLYPPLSGPAIERLILKLDKEKQAEDESANAIQNQVQNIKKNKETDQQLIQVKSKAMAQLNSVDQNRNHNLGLHPNTEESLADNADNNEFHDSKETDLLNPSTISSDGTNSTSIFKLNSAQKKKRTLSLKNKRTLYENFPKKPLQAIQKNKLKEIIENEILNDIKDLESTFDSEINFEDSKPVTESNIAYMPDDQNTMSSQSTQNFNQEISDNKKKSLAYVPDKATQLGGIATVNSKQNLCLVIESETWTGFVIGSCDGEIDAQLFGPLLIKWIYAIYPETIDNENYDFYNLQVDPVRFGEWARSKSDHYEVTQFNNFNLMMTAYSIEPSELTFNVIETHDLIELPIPYIKSNEILNFNLQLFLPENNKYILYALAGYEFSTEQKRRLADKKVSSLFTSVDYEQQARQLKINFLFDQLMGLIQAETLS